MTENADLAREIINAGTGFGRHSDGEKIDYAAEANAIIANITGSLDVHDLVAKARERFALAIVTGDDSPKLEAPDAQLVNEITARAAELARISKSAEAEREQLTAVLKDLLAEHDELTVHGAVVATYKAPAVSRVLDQAYIKNLFPDIPGNEEFWKDQASSRRFLYK